MKKGIIISLAFFVFTFTAYVLSSSFNFDSSKLTFSVNSKEETVTNSFDKEYDLTNSLLNENSEFKNTIVELSKKTTYLLLGNMNGLKETSENYYKRHDDYRKMALYNYFPKDKSSKSGYDESVDNYKYAIASEFAIPQLFNSFNELGVIYNSYGDIRVTISDNLIISTVTLPDVKIKEQNKDEPMKYDLVDTNLIIYYYFLKIDNEYRLAYLYGETTDSVNEYFAEIENKENPSTKVTTTSYESNLSKIYNFDKLNSMSEEEFKKIYNSNLNNIVYLSAYYNNQVTSTANGFFINNGIVVTTWSFLEESLINSQYIAIRNSNGKSYEIDGIITANPETNVALIKLKKQNGNSVKLGNSNEMSIEDPVITISSKSGVGLIIQKGILISNDDYLQTSIPLSQTDEGSPLFDAKGNVIGINTSNSTSTSISIAINSNILKEIQDKFNLIEFNSINTTSFDKLKEEHYYVNYSNETVINDIPKSKWEIYSKIGDIENNIKLELVKASYKDGIVSLRYKNNISKYINSMQLASAYKEQLISEGYKETLNSGNKCIYENNKYKIIIMEEFDYLIVVVVNL